jgi:hypothetical protein
MFTVEGRERLRAALVSAAGADERITGAALTGSAALGAADRWSDIDLAFGVAAEADLGQVIADWTGLMYTGHGAVHHLDVVSAARSTGFSCWSAPCRSTWPSRRRRTSAPRPRPSGCSSGPRRSSRRQRHPARLTLSAWAGSTRCTLVRAWPAAGYGRRST